MRSKTVKRHYCDHCSKGLFSRSAMERHESACIKNPARSSCPLCELAKLEMTHIADLRNAFIAGGLEKLSDAANACPACILAAIVQTKEDDDDWVDFDYNKSKNEFYSGKWNS